MKRQRTYPLLALVTGIALAPAAARAQTPGDDSSGPAQSESGFSGPRGHHGGRHNDPGSEHHAAPMPKLKRDPWQRLDTGALVCPTEAQLRQHQAAVMARLQGGDASEPRGCKLIRAMVPVSVLDRDGPARTEIQTHDAEAATFWTDALVRDPPSTGTAPPAADDAH
jgi:hypothetical protein